VSGAVVAEEEEEEEEGRASPLIQQPSTLACYGFTVVNKKCMKPTNPSFVDHFNAYASAAVDTCLWDEEKEEEEEEEELVMAVRSMHSTRTWLTLAAAARCTRTPAVVVRVSTAGGANFNVVMVHQRQKGVCLHIGIMDCKKTMVLTAAAAVHDTTSHHSCPWREQVASSHTTKILL
jgi:hypothetical protein